MTPHRIDVHHHILPPDYVQRIGDARIGPMMVSGKTPVWSPDHSLALMDRHEIETAVTSISAPGLELADPAETADLTRHCNDYAAALRRDHPGRFGLFAALPLPHVDASLEEIRYALDDLRADGIGLMTSYAGQHPGEPAFAPVFDELDRRGAVVFFHPTAAACCTCLPGLPAATLEFPFDTTRAVASLLFSGTFNRCRNIRWIFSHAGGTVPFLAERMARLEQRPDFKPAVPEGVREELRRLYFDTALSANGVALSALLELTAPEHILFGSDYPFAPEPTTAASIAALAQLDLPPGLLRAIERENALRLLPGLGRI